MSFTTTGAGSFSGAPCVLVALGTNGAKCDVTYTPTNAAVSPHVITANYSGSGLHKISSGSSSLGVNKRPTSTSITCAPPLAQINTGIDRLHGHRDRRRPRCLGVAADRHRVRSLATVRPVDLCCLTR